MSETNAMDTVDAMDTTEVVDVVDSTDNRSPSGSVAGDKKKRKRRQRQAQAQAVEVNGAATPDHKNKAAKAKEANGKDKDSNVKEKDNKDTNGERRLSLSMPARDLRDEPQPKKSKRRRREKKTDDEKTNGKNSTHASGANGTVKGHGNTTNGQTTVLVHRSRGSSPMIDFDGLSRPSFGTRTRLDESEAEQEARLGRMKAAVRVLLESVGEDPDREGLLATPERYARAMLFFTQGYQQNIRDIVNGAIFQEGHNEMVIVKDIDTYSLCEHHLVPFTGKMHIGYIPRNAVIGISKLPRIAEMFARRLQIQERLTKDVANAIYEVLQPQGVAVVMESSHLCMVMRGVQKTGSSTVTSCVLGCFESKEKTRNEFLSLVGVGR